MTDMAASCGRLSDSCPSTAAQRIVHEPWRDDSPAGKGGATKDTLGIPYQAAVPSHQETGSVTGMETGSVTGMETGMVDSAVARVDG